MDGLYILSMEERVLKQPFLRIEDIKIGEVVKGTIERVLDRGGVVVKVADGISGIVEEDHLNDVKLKNPEKKFRVGLGVKARVLATNPWRRKLRLTLKKTLVNSDAPIIASYNVEPGSQSVGTLVSILTNGAVVKFYAGVSAFLPVREMSEAYIQNPTEHFHIGQSVNIHVLSVDAENKKMRVSCKDPNAFGEEQKKALADLKIGQIVSSKISEKSVDDIVVELEGVGSSGLKGVVMVGQLTDGSREKNNKTLRKFRAGQYLGELVILDKNEGRRMIHLSLKPSLIKAAKEGSLVTSFEKINEGDIVRGFIKNTNDIGAFVSFAGGVTGLALRSALPSEMQPIPGFGFFKHQSIAARVFAMNHDEKKFLLSLKNVDETKPQESTAARKVETRVALNSVDGESKTIDDYELGKITKAKIISVQETQINVQLADNVQGRVDVSQVFDSWSDFKNKKSPLSTYKKGTVLDVKVIGLHDARNHRFLAISHRTSSNKSPIFELTAKPSALKLEVFAPLTLDKVTVGSNWLGFVNNVAVDCIWINISPDIRGRIRLLDLSDDVGQLRDLTKHFPVGSALKCHVVNVDSQHGKLDLSAKAHASHKLDFDGLSKGMVVPGRVTKVLDRSVLVQLNDVVAGVVNLTDIADDFTQAKVSNFDKNDIVRVCVVNIDKPNKRVTLSTRPSRVMNSSLPVKDAEVHDIHNVKDRELRRGFVKNVSDKGLFVTLGSDVTAWVKVSDLSDTFLKEWKTKFQVDQVVEGRIVGVDYPLGHIQMSLRPSAISGKVPERQNGLSDFTKGQIVSGKVKKVADYGVFVGIDGSNVSGLCHKSEIADRKVEDISKLYAEGDPVKAKILSIDLEKRRISFGLKASYFKDADESDSEDGGMDLDEADKSDEDSEAGGVDLSRLKEIDISDEEDEDDAASDISMEDAPVLTEGLSAGGFDWTASSIFEKRQREVDSDFESDTTKDKRKKKRKSEIKQDLTGDMLSREPQSVTDFERLLLGDPNDSRLWIQYMAFQLQLSEIDKAREIAERALKTIGQKEDTEKRNVWVALLNMENAYGDDETLEETFKRAVQFNDAQDMHERMASIYIQSNKSGKADALFKLMIKKFSQAPKIWINYADFLLSANNRTSARDLLKRALQALSRDLHRDLIIKFASLEFRTGDPERGRTLFENLIGAYNKRMDIWNVFLDMEIKHGGSGREHEDQVKGLFKRALEDDRCAPKQASWLFKKWKEFEEKLPGNEKGVQEVMTRAKAYVAKAKKE
jgi:rRNA biogenesis protein RRP5